MKDSSLFINSKEKLENTYINLPEVMYANQSPSPIPTPELVILNTKLAKELGLSIDFLESEYGVDILSGNKVLEGITPIAQAYAGHQFGYFTMLGDGRAVLLGECITSKGERYDIQLKGSGRTKYSRGGDGKATLGPMLREYIISEGMHALGIPSTRSLSVTTTGETIWRERELPGAVLARVAKSHIRVGTFQFVAQWGSREELKALADYTLKRHFKEGLNEENPYLYLLKEVVKRQAELISKWMLVGFIHGVMNTDNMVISGETIDYGPCAFMDTYDTNTVFSSIDMNGRYAYGNQPNIGAWNLSRFAETLLPLISNDKDEAISLAQKEISNYSNLYKQNWYDGMRKKLGLFNEDENDIYLIEALLTLMEHHKADYTNTFRLLTINKIEDIEFYNTEDFKKWYELWQLRLSKQEQSQDECIKLMQSNNPRVIPRNHRVEEALEAAVNNNDYTIMYSLLNAITKPYDYSIEDDYTKLPKTTSCKYKTYCGT